MGDPSSFMSSGGSSGGSSTSADAEGGGFGTMLGGIGKAIGAFTEGQDTKAMYDYQAGIANLNAQIAYQNSEYAIQTGEHQAAQAGIRGAQTLGAIKVAQGASGLDVNTGSAKDVQTSQQMINRQDQATIRSNAAKTAYGYTVEGVGFGAQAQLDTMAGKNAQTAGFINAASSIIGASSSVASQWSKGSQVGLFGTGTTPPSALGTTSGSSGGYNVDAMFGNLDDQAFG